jgi:mannose-6-phosphate isomerase
MLEPFMLEPLYREYIWGGNRLRTNVEKTAEAWIVYEKNKVANGKYLGKTLAEVADKEGEALLGNQVVMHTGNRFPLLIKLLDCADWLSLQVHPNDEQAQRLEGLDFFGKTEAWYVVEADEKAQLLAGLVGGVNREDIKTGLETGRILALTQHHDVKTGDYIFIPAGMIHALGPGLLIYEVQQTSDITYRVYDWDRPLTAGRKLHIDQAAEVLNPDIRAELLSSPQDDSEGSKTLLTSPYFRLDLITGKSGTLDLEPCQGSFSTITILDGRTIIRGPGWAFKLARFETLVIPANWKAIQIEMKGQVRALRSTANAGQLEQPR